MAAAKTFSSVGQTRRIQGVALMPYLKKSLAKTTEEKHFQDVLYALKNGRTLNLVDGTSERASDLFARLLSSLVKVKKLLAGRVLVPIPGHTVTTPNRRWAGLDLATSLVSHGIGLRVAPCVHRVTEVAESHGANGQTKRPNLPTQVASMRVVGLLPEEPIALVDDMVTSGCTAAAVWTVLTEQGHLDCARLLAGGYNATELGTKGPREFRIGWSGGATRTQLTLLGTAE